MHNPNDRALPIRSLEYTVEVDGQEFASGASVDSFVVPPLGEAEFDVSGTTDLANGLIGLLGHAGSGKNEVGCRLVGKVSLSEGFVRTVPFDERGLFRLH